MPNAMDSTAEMKLPPEGGPDGKPYLRIFGMREGCREVDLGDKALIIGRSSDADIRFKSDYVSRVHATVSPERGGFVLRDNDSSAGTLLNGREVRQARLEHGDTIQIADHVIQFRRDGRSLDPASLDTGDTRALSAEELLTRFSRLPTTMRVRFRVIHCAPKEIFSAGDTVRIGSGGILLPFRESPGRQTSLEIEMTWPGGAKRCFLGEFLGIIQDRGTRMMCVKMHRVEEDLYQIVLEKSRRGEWEAVEG